MKLDEYIRQLTQILNTEGNLEVFDKIYPQCNVSIQIRYMRIPKDKRETQITFYQEGYSRPSQKGNKVVAI